MTPSSAISVPEPEWAACVAIDWADQKNFWSLEIGQLGCGRKRSGREGGEGFSGQREFRGL